MLVRVFRHLVITLSLLAFVASGLAPAIAMPVSTMSGVAMPAMSMAPEAPMPCCPEKAPPCVTDVGCVFLIGLPMPALTVSKALTSSALAYGVSHDRGEGLSIEPALGPPIFLA